MVKDEHSRPQANRNRANVAHWQVAQTNLSQPDIVLHLNKLGQPQQAAFLCYQKGCIIGIVYRHESASETKEKTWAV